LSYQITHPGGPDHSADFGDSVPKSVSLGVIPTEYGTLSINVNYINYNVPLTNINIGNNLVENYEPSKATKPHPVPKIQYKTPDTKTRDPIHGTSQPISIPSPFGLLAHNQPTVTFSPSPLELPSPPFSANSVGNTSDPISKADEEKNKAILENSTPPFAHVEAPPISLLRYRSPFHSTGTGTEQQYLPYQFTNLSISPFRDSPAILEGDTPRKESDKKEDLDSPADLPHYDNQKLDISKQEVSAFAFSDDFIGNDEHAMIGKFIMECQEVESLHLSSFDDYLRTFFYDLDASQDALDDSIFSRFN